MSLTIVFSREFRFTSSKITEILGILVTARDVPFEILLSVKPAGSTASDRAFDIALVCLDVFTAIVVSFDVFYNIENRTMADYLPHYTYLSSC